MAAGESGVADASDRASRRGAHGRLQHIGRGRGGAVDPDDRGRGRRGLQRRRQAGALVAAELAERPGSTTRPATCTSPTPATTASAASAWTASSRRSPARASAASPATAARRWRRSSTSRAPSRWPRTAPCTSPTPATTACGASAPTGSSRPSRERVSSDVNTDVLPAVQSILQAPAGIALDPAGRVVIADTGNGLVRRIEPDGTLVVIVGVIYYGAYNGDNIPATAAYLDDPVGPRLRRGRQPPDRRVGQPSRPARRRGQRPDHDRRGHRRRLQQRRRRGLGAGRRAEPAGRRRGRRDGRDLHRGDGRRARAAGRYRRPHLHRGGHGRGRLRRRPRPGDEGEAVPPDRPGGRRARAAADRRHGQPAHPPGRRPAARPRQGGPRLRERQAGRAGQDPPDDGGAPDVRHLRLRRAAGRRAADHGHLHRPAHPRRTGGQAGRTSGS